MEETDKEFESYTALITDAIKAKDWDAVSEYLKKKKELIIKMKQFLLETV
jgi:hypothetical protein